MDKVTSITAAVLLILPSAAQDLSGINLFDQQPTPPNHPRQPAAQNQRASQGQQTPANHTQEASKNSAHYALADLDNYLSKTTTQLAILSRQKDPFGLNVDPSVQDAPKVNPVKEVVTQTAPRLPFSDIINSINVNAVMPAEKRFLVGSRTIREGEVLPLSIPDGTLNVRVVAVQANGIVFENLEDKTTAVLRANLMPRGMSRGSDGIKVLGMQPEATSTPLKVDVKILPTSPAPR